MGQPIRVPAGAGLSAVFFFSARFLCWFSSVFIAVLGFLCFGSGFLRFYFSFFLFFFWFSLSGFNGFHLGVDFLCFFIGIFFLLFSFLTHAYIFYTHFTFLVDAKNIFYTHLNFKKNMFCCILFFINTVHVSYTSQTLFINV